MNLSQMLPQYCHKTTLPANYWSPSQATSNQLYTENRGAYTLGDLDGNGTVTSSDANIVRQIHMQTITPTEQQSSAADINGDGRVNLLDYALITQFVNKTAYFPPE